MILLTKNTTKELPFYLTPTKSTPVYSIKLEHKTTNKVNYVSLINISNTTVLQQFSFNDIITNYDIGTYNYKIYENDATIIPTETSNILEVGLLVILGSGDCVPSNIEYDNGVEKIVYYDC
tara:strand:+ start:5314 stop:5676 length:363 start_codon:yes stop_codon:yes gene_type:complete